MTDTETPTKRRRAGKVDQPPATAGELADGRSPTDRLPVAATLQEGGAEPVEAAAPRLVITEPGVYPDLDEAVYHADPVPESSLSYSGAKVLLKSPARFRYDQDHPPDGKKEFDFGNAAHGKVLGRGSAVAVIPDEVLGRDGAASTTAAKEFIAEAKAAGLVPLKREAARVVDGMAAALAAHPLSRTFFRTGVPEQSLFQRDPDTHVMLRCRLDWVTKLPSGRPCIVDYKTSRSADPDEFRWDAGRYRYLMQDPWYRELADLAFGEEHAFVFCVQEKDPPYLVSFVELDDRSREVGVQNNRAARRLYLECMTRGEWPGYPPVVHRITVPNATFAPEGAEAA